ncbi:hypothetical protein MNB_SUP05-5-953 [hydrothermal vent metagenome]|uniref:Uncharacterized protein n=1 Tax=hydrothermal vent metagenome TaxID=652676 RepID=A0A1W1CDL5_9ZZZZ
MDKTSLILEKNDNHSVISVLDSQKIKLQNNQLISTPCFINAKKIITDISFDFQSMSIEKLNSLIDEPKTILLIGLSKLLFIDEKLKQQLYQKNIAVEVMQTKHACHGFNILLSEMRPVGLLLL